VRTSDQQRWNHNIHYHRLILSAVPGDARRALDVGCGEGMLVRRLHDVVPEVVGIDLDAASIETALATDCEGITYAAADFMTYPFEPAASFDVVTSVATLHHLDAVAGLTRMKDLLAPGGVLAVVGLARSAITGLPYELAGALAHRGHVSRLHRKGQARWEHPSPTVWPPPHTYADVRRLSAELLPGRRYRRHALWRYSLIWTKPGAS
jgi:SAM-dependent methyltransferase